MGILARPAFLPDLLEPVAEPCTGGLVLSSLQKVNATREDGRNFWNGIGTSKPRSFNRGPGTSQAIKKRKVHQAKGNGPCNRSVRKEWLVTLPFSEKSMVGICQGQSGLIHAPPVPAKLMPHGRAVDRVDG